MREMSIGDTKEQKTVGEKGGVKRTRLEKVSEGMKEDNHLSTGS